MATEAAGALAGHGEAVWLAELAPVRDGDQVAQAVAPRALAILALLAHRRGRDQAALAHLQEAAAVCRELDDPAQLSDLLANLSVLQVTVGQQAEAVQSMVESAHLVGQVDRDPGRPWLLAAAAVLLL